MKKIILTALVAALSLQSINLFAQGKYGADSAECIKYLSYYSEYYKQKSYDDALPSWRKAYEICPPTARQGLFIDGTSLMRRLIVKNMKNVEYRESLIDTLLTLHSTRAEYYPKYKVTALNNKGLDVVNYIKDNDQRVFDLLEEIIGDNGSLTQGSIFINNLNAAISLYQAGVVDAEAVINTYQRNLAYLSEYKAKDAADAEKNENVRKDLEGLFISSKVAGCESLISIFTPRYEANPDDLETATNIVKMMGVTDGCMDNELFLKAVTTMYKLDPSYSSAYFLFKLNSSRANSADAIKYMEEAIAYDESDSRQDAEYYYELATYCYKNGMSAKAFSAARSAAQLDPVWEGKAYFLIANIWGATTCGGDEIAKRAPYWVACDYLIKAKNADEYLAEEANKLIANYSKYFPEKTDIFMNMYEEGKSFTVNCNGMSATTVIRAAK